MVVSSCAARSSSPSRESCTSSFSSSSSLSRECFSLKRDSWWAVNYRELHITHVQNTVTLIQAHSLRSSSSPSACSSASSSRRLLSSTWTSSANATLRARLAIFLGTAPGPGHKSGSRPPQLHPPRSKMVTICFASSS